MESIFVRLEATPDLPDALSVNLPDTLWICLEKGSLTDEKRVVLWGVTLSDPQERIPLVSKRTSSIFVAHFDVEKTLNGILTEEYHSGLEMPWEFGGFGKLFKDRFRTFPPETTPKVLFPSFVSPYCVDWLHSLAKLVNVSACGAIQDISWPEKFRAALTLSYNVENDWIFRSRTWFDRFLSLESNFGMKATWYCAPTNSKSRLALKGLDLLKNRGIEIGCFGFNGDGRLPFLVGKPLQKRIDGIEKFSKIWGVRGFRSEWMYRKPEFTNLLSGKFLYDSSVPTDSSWFSSETRNGCGFPRPYHVRPDVIEIPVTLLQGVSRADMGMNVNWFWERQYERARRLFTMGALVHVVLYPQLLQTANEESFLAVESFFRKLAEFSGIWKASNGEIADLLKSSMNLEQILQKAA